MQIYVSNKELRLHYVQAMELTVSLGDVCVCVRECVCLHSEWIKGSRGSSSSSSQEEH